MPFREAVAQVCAAVKTPPGKRLAGFLQGDSKRGIAGGSKQEPMIEDRTSED